MESKFRKDNHMKYGCRLFNDNWEFLKLPLSADFQELDAKQEHFEKVGLPHDWLIYQADNLYENGSGWYRRLLEWNGESDKELVLRFEGIYMDSTIYVNREQVAQWKYGYSTFEVIITPYLKEGQNEILVRVDFQAPNSRWYSGAGIYRDIWMKVRHQMAYLVSDGSYITIQEKKEDVWELDVTTQVAVSKAAGVLFSNIDEISVEYQLIDQETKELWKFADNEGIRLVKLTDESTFDDAFLQSEFSCSGDKLFSARMKEEILAPALWDIDSPHRYRLLVRLMVKKEEWQREEYTIGFRTVRFSPEEGFLLNHKKRKLNGVCEHHDLGALGAAYHSAAMRRKLKTLQRMGVNAIRLSHNMPAPDVMELADELGLLVLSEAFDMWELPKNRYDYARFFKEWYKKDVASWIRRDRNHPSLIMWSIGNEIYDTHVSERGQELTQMLADEVRIHDPKGNGVITMGSNYMPWENAKKCVDLLKIVGYNYAEKYYEEHHKMHPDWVIYGSETGSVVQSRGIYHFPYHQPVLADEDEQCSSLGNSATSWGAKSVESCILAERDHPFSCGQFIWTGFDYIGEPTPYHTRNSYFGQVDTAGFEKDSFYLYQAEWTDYKSHPMVHLFPYWDFNKGQLIDVLVCSNAPEVELFLNGKSKGRFPIDHKHGTKLVGHWQIPYEIGEIMAVAYNEEGKEIAREVRHSFDEAVKIVMKADRDFLYGTGRDLGFIEISVLDKNGNPVENATNRIHIKVSGAGYLAGLDNGDSTDTDEYKTENKKLFSGKLLAIIAAKSGEGEIQIEAASFGLTGASLSIPVKKAEKIEGIGEGAYKVIDSMDKKDRMDHAELSVRAIRLFPENTTLLTANHQVETVYAEICPSQAFDKELFWSAVNDAGILSDIAQVKAEGEKAIVTAKGDGTFRLRCKSKSGTNKIRVLSELEFTIKGIGKKWLDPYGFIAGGQYDYSYGEIGNGNEHGVATARDGESRVGFHGIDFGNFGSDRITLPVFALDDKEYSIQVWEGMPDEEGSMVIGNLIYQKPSRWNVYQEATYQLDKRLKGVTSLCFVLHQKIHLKGFSFLLLKKAYQKLFAAECNQVYGDSFFRQGNEIQQIGNNVTILFDEMDFGKESARHLTVCGHTPLEKNAIQIQFRSQDQTKVILVEFKGTKGETEQTFEIEPVSGNQRVSFIFLPGSQFDFSWFQFGY